MKQGENGEIFLEEDEYKDLLTTMANEQKEALRKKLAEEKGVPEASITLYDLNKQVIKTLKVLTQKEISQRRHAVIEWLIKNPDTYYMMLGNEDHFYTVFHVNSDRGALVNSFIDYLIDCFYNIRVIEEDNNGCLAVWGNFVQPTINEDTETIEPHVFYLFPYSQGVIEA